MEVKVIGPQIHTGRMPIPELVILCNSLQSAVERQAEAMEGRDSLRPGPTTRKVLAECTLELVSLGKGSAVLAFEPSNDQRDLPNVRTRALAAINGVVESIDALARGKDREIDPGVLDSLKGLGEVLDRKKVKQVQLVAVVPGQRRKLRTAFNASVYRRVERRLRPPTTRPVSLDGVLEMADFKPGDHKCRLHPAVGPTVTCSFGPDLADQVYAVLRQPVHIEGTGDHNAHTGKLESVVIKKVDPLNPLSANAGSFFGGWSLDQLVQAQAVDRLRDPKVLAGGLPADEDVDDLLHEIYHRRH